MEIWVTPGGGWGGAIEYSFFPDYQSNLHQEKRKRRRAERERERRGERGGESEEQGDMHR